MDRLMSMQANLPTQTPPPSIRLITATPSASGSTEPNTSITYPTSTPSVPIGGWGAPPAVPARQPGIASKPSRLALKRDENDNPSNKKKSRLVPKRSKLFSNNSNSHGPSSISHKKSRDLSDVVRRVGGGSTSSLNILNQHDHGRENSLTLARRGYEIYVDSPQDGDEDLEVVVVKKVKSRAGLKGIFGGEERRVLGDSTNTRPSTPMTHIQDNGPSMSSVRSRRLMDQNAIPDLADSQGAKASKDKEGNKWWTIGRGRKDSKDKEKTQDKRSKTPDALKFGSRRLFSSGPKSAELPRPNTPDIASYLNSQQPRSAGVPSRSMTPEPFSQPFESVGRNRAASFDVLRNYENDPKLRAFHPPPTVQPPPSGDGIPPRAMTPSLSSTVAPTPANTMRHYPQEMESIPPRSKSPAPSIPLRSASPAPSIALRSTTPTSANLLAPPPEASTLNAGNSGSIAFRAIRSVKSFARMGGGEGAISEPDKKKAKAKGKKEVVRSGPKSSSSSFEIGSASPMAKKTQHVEKKKSILGLGLGIPSSLRLKGSTTPSEIIAAANQVDDNAARRSYDMLRQPVKSDRLSVDSAYLLKTREMRTSSVSSTSTSSHEMLPASAADKGKARDSLSSGASSIRPNSVASSARSSYVHSGPLAHLSQVRRASNASSSGGGGYTYHDGLGRDSIDGTGIKRDSLDVQIPASRKASTGSSIRWDETRLEVEKQKMLDSRRSSSSQNPSSGLEDGATKRENRHSAEGRKRAAIADIFPGLSAASENEWESEAGDSSQEYPLLMLEEATSDGHGSVGVRTPEKKTRRVRPISDNAFQNKRMGGFFDPPKLDGSEGVLSMLDAATNDLEKLIDVLDLEATPGNTPNSRYSPSSLHGDGIGDGSPHRFGHSLTVQDSLCSLRRATQRMGSSEHDLSTVRRQDSLAAILPKASLEGTLGPRKGTEISTPSLRPYAQSRKNSGSGSDSDSKDAGLASYSPPSSAQAVVGKQIAPWPALKLSPHRKPAASAATPVFKAPSKHIRGKLSLDGTPEPMPDTPPLFHPLKPSMSKLRIAPFEDPNHSSPTNANVLRTSMVTFGQRSVSSRDGSAGSFEELTAKGLPRVFTKPGHERKISSPLQLQDKAQPASIPIPPETKRVLGMAGTMGGSDSSAHRAELDENDPDSDIPDELQVILSGGSDDETNRVPVKQLRSGTIPSPGLPPGAPLPLPTIIDAPPQIPQFRASLIDQNEHHTDIDTSDDSDGGENHTKKSFDFTGELQKLNESGGSDRRSFVEQLEHAFRTPAKVDLRYDFGDGQEDGLLRVDVPPVPQIPPQFRGSEPQLGDITSNQNVSNDSSVPQDEGDSLSHILSTQEPSLLPGSDSLGPIDDSQRDVAQSRDAMPHPSSPSESDQASPSFGELDRSFKFGRGPKIAPPKQAVPTSAGTSLSKTPSSASLEGNSVLKSIYKSAAPVLSERHRANSDISIHSRRLSQDIMDLTSTHSSDVATNTKSRPTSTISFQGFESFTEVRRGFEFPDDRPMFYPPPAAQNNHRRRHARDPSMFSIASISSYGHVLNNGDADPFDYALPSLRERPSSEDMTNMSYSVDDTFSFIHQGIRRRRVDSDASNFSFRPMTGRGHRRQDSNMSVISQGPPISKFNRSFSHRRNESNTSAGSSSMAHSYVMHGANAGRAAWARHRPNMSVDSISSDFSVSRLGRPGLGDKMFETAAAPLASIAASPTESLLGEQHHFFQVNRTSYDFDSIMDAPRTVSMVEDSLFEKTGIRSSGSSESLFGWDGSHPSQPHLLPPTHFRPVSGLSSFADTMSPVREDDTMISMLGGGHVRRSSVGSMITGSPCVRMEKRKRGSTAQDPYQEPQIVQKPSIASTSTFQFGGERMIRAQQGLLHRESLEESCLVAEGEDPSLQYVPPVFSRPALTSRSRSSTCTTSSSECPTPPLSASDGSISEVSPQSSLDLSQVSFTLTSSANPLPPRSRARARPPGTGHRRRPSQAQASRSSVYETIEEEHSNRSSPASSKASKQSSPTIHPPAVCIVDPSRRASLDSNHGSSLWEDDQGVQALRRYYALRDEAQETVKESRKVWLDTPISLFAVQSFQPPKQPEDMKAMLHASVENYHALPHELNPRRTRSRTSSRPSPYPKEARNFKPHPSSDSSREMDSFSSFGSLALREVSLNIQMSPAPTLDVMKPFSPLIINTENISSPFAPPPKDVRPRVGSAARRTALGWSKRSAKSSNGQKENTSHGALMTPGASLRINRPTPAARRRAANRA